MFVLLPREKREDNKIKADYVKHNFTGRRAPRSRLPVADSLEAGTPPYFGAPMYCTPIPFRQSAAPGSRGFGAQTRGWLPARSNE